MRPFFLCAPFLLPLASCTSVPTAQVAGIRLERQGAEGGRVVVTVHLENKTSTPMPIVGATYWVAVVGADPMKPFEIDDRPFMTVPADTRTKSGAKEPGIQEVELPAGIPAFAALAGKECVIEGEFTFEPDTDWRRLKSEVGVPLPTRSFRGVAVLAPAAAPAVPAQADAKQSKP